MRDPGGSRGNPSEAEYRRDDRDNEQDYGPVERSPPVSEKERPLRPALERLTIRAIERELAVDGLLLRYRNHEHVESLPPGEGVFLACSFWLADVLVMSGRRDEARTLFERLLGLRNDVGLLSEEYDPRTGRALGNFPQAFSHVGLINTAHNLTLARGPAERRAGTETAP